MQPLSTPRKVYKKSTQKVWTMSTQIMHTVDTQYLNKTKYIKYMKIIIIKNNLINM